MKREDGILYGTRAYLAGNLENSDPSCDWRTHVKNEFHKMGVIPLDPTDVMFYDQPRETEEDRQQFKVWRDNGEHEKIRELMIPIVQKDLRQIDLSDFILFNFQPEKPTSGTHHELHAANYQKKPVFLSVDGKNNTPLWFYGIVKHKYIYNNIDEILEMLHNINEGKTEIDSARWRLLKHEFRQPKPL